MLSGVALACGWPKSKQERQRLIEDFRQHGAYVVAQFGTRGGIFRARWKRLCGQLAIRAADELAQKPLHRQRMIQVDQRRALSDDGKVAPVKDTDKCQGVEKDATPEHHILVGDAEGGKSAYSSFR